MNGNKYYKLNPNSHYFTLNRLKRGNEGNTFADTFVPSSNTSYYFIWDINAL